MRQIYYILAIVSYISMQQFTSCTKTWDNKIHWSKAHQFDVKKKMERDALLKSKWCQPLCAHLRKQLANVKAQNLNLKRENYLLKRRNSSRDVALKKKRGGALSKKLFGKTILSSNNSLMKICATVNFKSDANKKKLFESDESLVINLNFEIKLKELADNRRMMNKLDSNRVSIDVKFINQSDTNEQLFHIPSRQLVDDKQRNVRFSKEAATPSNILSVHQTQQPCDSTFESFCSYNGECLIADTLNTKYCKCASGYKGARCEIYDMLRSAADSQDSSSKQSAPTYQENAGDPFDTILDS